MVPFGKLSHGPPFAVMGNNLIRNRAGLVKSPTYRIDTHSDPSRPEVPFVHSSLLCIFPSLIYLCGGAGGDYFCSRIACWGVQRKSIGQCDITIWMIKWFLNVSLDLCRWSTRLIKMSVEGYWRLRATLHWFDLWDRIRSFFCLLVLLLYRSENLDLFTPTSPTSGHRKLFLLGKRKKNLFNSVGSGCSWWWLLSLAGLHVDYPSCFIKQLGPRALSWHGAHQCQQESSVAVAAMGSWRDVVSQEPCWAVRFCFWRCS